MMSGMMDGSMMNGMMAFCMIATALFVLVIMVTLIVQSVLQSRMLGELRKLNAGRSGEAQSPGAAGQKEVISP